jgi:adenine-specific DNA-methyltransferase
MASMFEAKQEKLTLLDAGAGVGSLTAAFVNEICCREGKPSSIHVTAYEIDPDLCGYLANTLGQCKQTCECDGIVFDFDVIQGDFIDAGADLLRNEIFSPLPRYKCAIMNPPYRKINSDSPERLALRSVGVETSNLYAGFLSIVLRMLGPNGELVAITPRSFCNGLYFKSFREIMLGALALRRIHDFDSRQIAFKDDEVLQENVILHGVKRVEKFECVTVSSSSGPDDDFVSQRQVPRDKIVTPGDSEHYIHIVPDELGATELLFSDTELADADLGESEHDTPRRIDAPRRCE